MTQRASDERLATLDDEVQKWGEVDLPGDESAVRDLCERALLDLRDCRAENKRLREAALVLKQAYDADAIAEWFMDTDEDGVDVKAVWCAALAASSGAGENEAASGEGATDAGAVPRQGQRRTKGNTGPRADAQAATPAPSDAALAAIREAKGVEG